MKMGGEIFKNLQSGPHYCSVPKNNHYLILLIKDVLISKQNFAR